MNWSDLERLYPAAAPHQNWMQPRNITPQGEKLPPGEFLYHAGRDITFPAGTIIKSQLPGKINYIGWIPNQNGPAFGYMVRIVNDDGSIYKYIHLEPSSVSVHNNQFLEAGDYIARTRFGKVGKSKSHLHLETNVDGKNIDPAIAIPNPLFYELNAYNHRESNIGFFFGGLILSWGLSGLWNKVFLK